MDADGKLQKKDEYFDDFDSDEFDSEATIANGVEPPVKAKDAQTLISDELLRYYNNPKVEDEHETVKGVYEINLETPQDEQKETRDNSSQSKKDNETYDDIDIDIDEMPDDVEVDASNKSEDIDSEEQSDENDDIDIEFLNDDSLEDFGDDSDENSKSTLDDNIGSGSMIGSSQQDSVDDNEFGIDFSDVDLDDMDDFDDETSQNSDDTQGSQTYEVKNVENSNDANDSSDDEDHDSLDDIDFQDLDDLDEIEDDSESQDNKQSLTQSRAVQEVNEDASNDEDTDSSDSDSSDSDSSVSDDDFDIDLSDIEDSDDDTEDSDNKSGNADKSDNEEKSESEQSDELEDIDFQDLDDVDINDDENDSNSSTNEDKADSEEKSESDESDDIDLSDLDGLDDFEEVEEDTESNKKSLSGADARTQNSDDDITKIVKDTAKEVKVKNDKSEGHVKKVSKPKETDQSNQVDDEVAELERKLAEAKKRKALANNQAKQVKKSSSENVARDSDNSLEAQKRRAAQLASEMRAKKQGKSGLDVPQKSIKKPAQSLLSENKILNKNNSDGLPARKKLTRHEKYAQLTDSRLMEYVSRFLQKNGVSKKPVDRKLLDAEFGSQNIQKLIKKSYLVSIGHGITLGI